MQLTLVCAHHKHMYIETPALTNSIQSKPQYCLKCAVPLYQQRTPDYADCLCLYNAGFTRQLAIKAITYVANHNAHCRSVRSFITPEQFMSQLGADSMPTLKQLSTPITVSCQSCAGQYTFIRQLKDLAHYTKRTQPLYCIWCASPNVTIIQNNPEETFWYTLSQVYNQPIPIMHILFDHWQKTSKYTQFSQYMQSDMVQQALITPNTVEVPA